MKYTANQGESTIAHYSSFSLRTPKRSLLTARLIRIIKGVEWVIIAAVDLAALAVIIAALCNQPSPLYVLMDFVKSVYP